MAGALVIRGQVYKHWQYSYPALGNVADKLIIVLNKNHLPTQPIIVVPVTTYRDTRKFSPGCKRVLEAYFIAANQDYFENDSKIQLHVLGLNAEISETEFIECQREGIISPEPLAMLSQHTISQIVNCIGQMGEDIRQDYREHL